MGLSFNPQIAISGSKGTDAEGMLRGVLGVTTTAACVTVAGDTSWGPAAILFLPTTAILGQGGNTGQGKQITGPVWPFPTGNLQL